MKKCKIAMVLLMFSAALVLPGCLPFQRGSGRKGDTSNPPFGSGMKEGQYVYELDGNLFVDGERIRFWGVNIVDNWTYAKTAIDHLVDRISELGFYAVRLHLYDIVFVDARAGSTRNLRTYAKGDNSNLDRFDYMIARFKERGIYCYMTFDRARVGFGPADYYILPPGEDEEEWKSAVASITDTWLFKRLVYVDERLQALHIEYAINLLNHYNKYTGKYYYEEEAFAIYEIFNENGFIHEVLTGDYFYSWPQFFKDKLISKWNDWLVQKYGSSSNLQAAWGSLQHGESLEVRTVRLEPTFASPGNYSDARGRDVTAFLFDLYIGYNERFIQQVRAVGKENKGIQVVPIAYNTWFQPNPYMHYASSGGDFMSGGVYLAPRVDINDNENPFRSRIGNGPLLYWLDMATVKDKAFVVYETNVFRPDEYRAEYPLMLSLLGSWQDWDGIFFYMWADGTIPRITDPKQWLNQPLKYSSESNRWSGVNTAVDQVFLSQMMAAGAMFKNEYIQPAPDPVVVRVGERYFGYAGGRTYDSFLTPLIRSSSFATGTRIEFDPNLNDYEIYGHPVMSLESPLTLLDQVVWGWDPNTGRGHMIIDRPEAKSFVGFIDEHDGRVDFGSIELSGIVNDFIAFSIVSLDGKSLEESSEQLISIVSRAQNRGFVFDVSRFSSAPTAETLGRGIVQSGFSPQDIEHVKGIITLNYNKIMQFDKYNFAFERIGRETGTTLTLTGEEDIFVIVVTDPKQ